MNGLPRQLQLGDLCCQLFETAEDLGDLLVPYFKEGLERNEACIWVTHEPYGKDRALSEMRAATDSFERRYARGQMQVFTHDEWYLRDGRLDLDNLIPRWLGKKDEAIASGYTGLRLTGNASFVEPADWPAFMAYERGVSQAFQGQPVAAVCSYCLAQTNVENLFEAVDSHAFTLPSAPGIGTCSVSATNASHRTCRGWSCAISLRIASPSTCAQNLTSSSSMVQGCFSRLSRRTILDWCSTNWSPMPPSMEPSQPQKVN